MIQGSLEKHLNLGLRQKEANCSDSKDSSKDYRAMANGSGANRKKFYEPHMG